MWHYKALYHERQSGVLPNTKYAHLQLDDRCEKRSIATKRAIAPRFSAEGMYIGAEECNSPFSITRVTRSPPRGRFGGPGALWASLQESFFSPVQGDFVA